MNCQDGETGMFLLKFCRTFHGWTILTFRLKTIEASKTIGLVNNDIRTVKLEYKRYYHESFGDATCTSSMRHFPKNKSNHL